MRVSIKRVALAVLALCLVMPLEGCNRRFAHAGDKKKAYKRKYKCKMCHVPSGAHPKQGLLAQVEGQSMFNLDSNYLNEQHQE